MAKPRGYRRENFDVSPEQQADIEALQSALGVPTKKEALLMAVQIALHLASETSKGNQIFAGYPGKTPHRLVILGLEKPKIQRWNYLIHHAHTWKKQLFLKGRNLSAFVVWTGMMANQLSVEDAMDNWDLPRDAILEVLNYCNANESMLEMEAAEELRLMKEQGKDWWQN